MNISFDVIGYTVGILSIGIAIVTFFLSKKEKIPIYFDSSTSVIGDKHSILGEDVRIFYKNALVTKLTRTDIIIRNIGREAIRVTDIPKSDSLKICFDKETRILSATIKEMTRAVIQFNVSVIKDNIVEFSFDFLDKKDGALIEIIHDGNPMQDPIITGTIIGAPRGFQKPDKSSMYTKWYEPFVSFAKLLLILALLFMFNFLFTDMETRFYPIAPSVADSTLGKELIKKASNGDRKAVREIRRLSGLKDETLLIWFERGLNSVLFIMAATLSIETIILFRRRRYTNLSNLQKVQ